MTEDPADQSSSEQTGPEQGGHHRGTPAAEQGSADRSPGGSLGAEDVPRDESEVRARIEEQIRNLRVQDLMVESVVSVLNLTARRLAKEDEEDLDQARIGIEAVRAWLDLLPEDAAAQIRNALSELQMLYAQKVEGGGGGPGGGSEEPPGEGEPPQPPPPPRRAGEPPPRLWTPPGTS